MVSKAPLPPIPFVLPQPPHVEGLPGAPGAVDPPLRGFPGVQTSFIGRDAELAALRALLLGSPQRLLSVLGPGGVGKTRLALSVAATVADAFPDGVAFVALSGLSEAGQVGNAIANTLEIQGQPERPILDSVLAALATERLLLVLDNLEHLMGAELQSLVTRLVQECSHLTILTTSREPLQLGLEQRVGVSPMRVPSADERATEVARIESVVLFISRAQAVAPDFAPGPDDLRIVGDICRRVEGLPLAIELAAAWIRVLSPASLLAQLSDQLPVLAGGGTDQPVRLRTMRDAIAWSYDRLSPEEAGLLRKLSVFHGGFPLEGAGYVHDDVGSGSQVTTLRLVASLCDKHLLYRADAIAELQRFGMLESVREFAYEQLGASGEVAAAKAAHARYYLALAERAESALLGQRENDWFAIFSAEESNVREAVSWGLAHENELAQRLLSASWALWSWRRVADGLRLVKAALALPDRGSPIVRARTLRTGAALAHLTGDLQSGSEMATEGATYIDRIPDRWLQGELIWNCACSALLAGRCEESIPTFDLALAYMDAPSSESERAIGAYVRSHRGAATCLIGNLEQGMQYYTDSLDTLRQIGGVALNIIVLSDAAGWLLQDGQTSEAKLLLREALHIASDAHASWLVMLPLSGMALIDALNGNGKRAARRIGAILTMARRVDLIITPNFQATLDQAEQLAREACGETLYRAELDAARRNPLPVFREASTGSRTIHGDTSTGDGGTAIGITRREREVLDLMVAGRTDRDIASELFISERTVSKHVSTILQKLDAVSRGDAAVRAVRLGLV